MNRPAPKKIKLHLRDPKEFEAAAEATLGEKFREARARQRAEEERERNPEIGQTMKDGSAFAGVNEKQGTKLFAAPAAAPRIMNFNAAAKYAHKMNAQKYLGYNNWRVPSILELERISRVKQAGGLKESFKALYYWSSTTMDDARAYYLNAFSISASGNIQRKTMKYAVCLVRSA
jgi:hypothetical protein